MKLYQVTFYDEYSHKKVSVKCKRIDITETLSIFYTHDGLTHRIPQTMRTINLESGIITVYYLDDSYIIITSAK